MNDQMPMFDDPVPAAQPPKKPKKPSRKSAKVAAPKKRRKRRTVKPQPYKNPERKPVFSPEAYRLIGVLMNLDIPLRNFVMEVTKALTK